MFRRLKAWIRYREVRAWYKRHERALIPGALILGFLVDLITFQSINLAVAQLILIGHLVISGGAILIQHAPLRSGRLSRYAKLLAPLAIQYSFGALLSAFLILYSHSGSVAASWPFLLILVALAISAEVLKKHFVRLIVQVSIFFFVLFSFLILAVPYVLRMINDLIFLISGIVALLAIAGFLSLLSRVSERAKERLGTLWKSVLFVLILVNVLYFTNLIPPFPLALRDVGVYYNVTRTEEGTYALVAEENPWYEVIVPFDRVPVSGERGTLYVYSAVFAPARLATDIVHEWRYHADEGWETHSKVSFPVVGGREGGYRGYSFVSGIQPGWWRVSVETETGRVIGRIRFKVVEADGAIETRVLEK